MLQMTSHTIDTISEFMLHAGTDYRVYDMGRGIESMNTQTFLDLESNKLPVPCPRAGQAWFAIVFWNKNLSQEQYIWFVKLPIDERSLLVQAARNQFLEAVVNALGSQLEKSEEKGGQLPENPFIFTPSQQQLADINAIIRRDLNLPARDSLNKAIEFVKNPDSETWQALSLQDIADLAANIDTNEIAEALKQNLALLPVQVLTALCSSFENCTFDDEFTDSLLSLYRNAEYAEVQHMILRGLKGSKSEQKVRAFIDTLLKEGEPDTECLVIIAGRHFRLLSEQSLLMAYFSKLIELDNTYQLFRGIYADLVQVPETRIGLLTLMRKQDLPADIANAIASLYQSVSPQKSTN
jgi:hypothetical protein